MIRNLGLAAVMTVAEVSATIAQEFSGAELGISYLIAPDADGVDRVNYYGAAEMTLPFDVSVGLDLSLYDYGFTSSTANNATIHLTYNLNSDTAVGLFFGAESLEETDVSFFGAEAVYNFGIAEVEGYLATADDDADEAILIGATGHYPITSNIMANAGFDNLSSDGFSTSVFEAGIDYTLDQGPTLGLVIGNVGVESDGDDASEFFFGVNASIAIGPNAGTTFNRRGFFEIVQFGFGN